jgi:hypothetical protein
MAMACFFWLVCGNPNHFEKQAIFHAGAPAADINYM